MKKLLLAPYVLLARKSYPAARDRYLAGLPEGHTFLVTTRLFDPSKNAYEQVFVEVLGIKDRKITGLVKSGTNLISNYNTETASLSRNMKSLTGPSSLPTTARKATSSANSSMSTRMAAFPSS